jgi:hypothetical protein
MLNGATPSSCPTCGAPLPARAAECDYCGSRARAPLDDEDLKRVCRTFVEALDKDISELATPRVVVGFLLFLLSIPAAYFVAKALGAGTWEAVLATFFVGLATMVAAGINLVSEEGRRFRNVLRPQVEEFLRRHRMGREEFLLVAHDTLEDSSSLLKHLDDLYGSP